MAILYADIQCTNPHNEAPRTGIINITPDEAIALLALHAAIETTRKELAEKELLHPTYPITVQRGDRLPALTVAEVLFIEGGEPDLTGMAPACIVLPDTVDWSNYPAHRTNGTRISLETGNKHIDPAGSFIFETVDHYSKDQFTSAAIPLAIIREIALSRPPSIPHLAESTLVVPVAT